MISATETEEQRIHKIADAIRRGEMFVFQLSPAMYEMWNLAEQDGQHSRDREVEQLKKQIEQVEQERDYWYERFANPGQKFTEMKQRRLQQAADEYYDLFSTGQVGKDFLSEIEHYVKAARPRTYDKSTITMQEN